MMNSRFVILITLMMKKTYLPLLMNDDKLAKGPKEEYVPEDDDKEEYGSGSGSD